MIVGVVVILVITSTLLTSDLFVSDSSTITVTNESITWVNDTGFTLSGYNSTWTSITSTFAYNDSEDISFNIANITISSTGVVTNATLLVWEGNDSVDLSYTYLHTFDQTEKLTADNLEKNFTTGLTEVGNKIPTILLIVAVVFLFGALVLLIRKAQEMGIDNSGSL